MKNENFYLITIGKYPSKIIDSAWTKKELVERRVAVLNRVFDKERVTVLHMTLNDERIKLNE